MNWKLGICRRVPKDASQRLGVPFFWVGGGVPIILVGVKIRAPYSRKEPFGDVWECMRQRGSYRVRVTRSRV